MKVSGAVKQKRRETRFVFAIKLLDQARRRGKAKLRTPRACIEDWQMQRFVKPGVVQIEMEGAADQKN